MKTEKGDSVINRGSFVRDQAVGISATPVMIEINYGKPTPASPCTSQAHKEFAGGRNVFEGMKSGSP